MEMCRYIWIYYDISRLVFFIMYILDKIPYILLLDKIVKFVASISQIFTGVQY